MYLRIRLTNGTESGLRGHVLQSYNKQQFELLDLQRRYAYSLRKHF
ncbi:hypothetical protein NITMOv2_1369 [Nitrospira moscoviensis]|uniref:Uncharacterized protein n=1 Tax=Nitrospira moscoviensis TaxID=42253 RepID=A0A0K2G9Z5_NITMO|nr:hypothetical protein NITMOv2_1369 [Nitrospira moscoviensis]